MYVYMKTTTDKYSLPIAIADSPKELAQILGLKVGSVKTMVSKRMCGYLKVWIGEDSNRCWSCIYSDTCGDSLMRIRR